MTGMRFKLVLMTTALVLAGCSSSGDDRAPRANEKPAGDENTVAEPGEISAYESQTKTAPTGVARFADLAHGVTTKKSTLEIRRRPKPSSRARGLAMTNPIDQRLVLLIHHVRSTENGDWLEVYLPERPNGSTAWVRRKDVRVVKLRHRIEVDLSKTTLKHFRNNQLIRRFKVGVGEDRYPTPKGVFYVWAKVPQPSPAGPYGNYALGISGFSPVLSDWPGGGRAAVHGTAVPGDKGQKVSHGCVRVFNDDMKKLTGVPMGTPVVIKR